MGINFSLDDFGTGVSNMESLVELDFEIVKIDKSILWNTKDYTAKDTFLENTIHLLKGSDFKIVVEGVETQEQKEFLRSHKCDFCQGFYFHKPASVFDFINYVKKFNHREDQDGSEGNSSVTV
jgi:EAL domain-containing protein (putative c-di-GMP-specific phosphodiesterase class I)